MYPKNRAWSTTIRQFVSSNTWNLRLNRACFSTPSSYEPPNVSVPMSELCCGAIPRDRVKKKYVRSSGAGGQNVNKVATKAEIRFNVNQADWIPERLKEQFISSNTGLINNAGECIVSSEVTRNQIENLDDCFVKLKLVLDGCSKDLIESLRMPTKQDEKILSDRAAKAAAIRKIQKEEFSNKKRNRGRDPFSSF